MTKYLDATIPKAKKDFENDLMVAFLGEKYSGKTVACALIKDALTMHYEKYSNGEYIGISTDGSTRMNKLMDKLTNEEFPAKTLLSEATPMTLEIVSTKEGNIIEVILRDMAGEQRKDLLEREFPSVEEGLETIFKTAIIEGKDYGLLTHVIFAKIYLIVIDCSKFNDDNKRRMEESYVKETIRHLFSYKDKIGTLVNNRINDPIAFLFTKYDQLPEEKQKPPGDLLEELSEVTGALKRYHLGEVACFKSSVDSVKLSDAEIQLKIKEKLSSENEDLKEANNNVNDLIVKKDDLKVELDNALKVLNTKKQELTAAEATGEQPTIDKAKNNVQDAKEEVSSSQEAYNGVTKELDKTRQRLSSIKEELEENPPTEPSELGISEYTPKKPLSYSLDDYLQLIEWIINMKKRITGYTK